LDFIKERIKMDGFIFILAILLFFWIFGYDTIEIYDSKKEKLMSFPPDRKKEDLCLEKEK
jgi:hypothetical protein